MKRSTILPAWLVLAAVCVVPRPIIAQDKVTLPSQILSIRNNSDLRLRYEAFNRSGPGTNDAQRIRYRLRVGADTQLPHNLLVGLRFASGTGEQISTNQTFDNLSAQKAIWIDMAYLRWTPQNSPDAMAYINAGRMPNPLWRLYVSDLLYDDDFPPEGFAEGGEWLVAGGQLSIFANLLQMVVDDDSKTNEGQWMFAEQAGLETHLPLNSRLRVAGSYNRWVREQRDDFGQAKVQDGNRRKPPVPPATSNATLENRFGTAEVTGQVSSWIRTTPITVQGTYAKNVRALDFDPKADTGYQVGVIVGRARVARSWEVAYFRKYAETDVAVADVTDSDFGDGGTNREGNIFWGAYNPEEWIQFRVKYYDTQTLDESLSPGQKDVKRVQADTVFRF